MNTKIIWGLALGLIAIQSAQADFYFSKPKNYVASLVAPEHGGLVGNGGGTVVCRDSQHAIKSIELLDFYEARILRNAKLDIDSIPGNWKAKTQAIIGRIQSKSEMRFQLYSEWLRRFETEEKLLNDIQFSTLPDSGYIGVPKGCGYEQAAIQRQPNFNGESRYFINADLWAAMNDSQKAGLVLHEIAYREAIGYGHTDSIRTRYLTALYSSESYPLLNIEQYVQLLAQAHYETTDVPVRGEFLGKVTSYLRTKRLWQSAPEEVDVLESIPLKDRMLIKLGACSEDCKSFKPSEFINFTTSGELSNDTEKLQIGGIVLKDNYPTTIISEGGVISENSASPLTDVKYNTFSLGGAVISFESPKELFTVSDVNPSGKEATSVKGVSLKLNPAGDAEWNGVTARVISSSRAPASNLGYNSVNQAFTYESCAFALVSYVDNIPISLSSLGLGTSECQSTWQKVKIDFVNQLNNGMAVTTVTAGSFTNIVMDHDHPNSFADANVPYSAWSNATMYAHCENDNLNCLKLNFDAGHNVSSLQVIASEVSLGKYTTNVDPTNPVMTTISSDAAANSVITLYPSGSIHTFVNAKPFVYTINGQNVNAAEGATIEMNINGDIVSIK